MLFYALAVTISRHRILGRLWENLILRSFDIPMHTTANYCHGSTVASGVLEAPNHQAMSVSGPRSITTASCWMSTSKPHLERKQAGYTRLIPGAANLCFYVLKTPNFFVYTIQDMYSLDVRIVLYSDTVSRKIVTMVCILISVPGWDDSIIRAPQSLALWGPYEVCLKSDARSIRFIQKKLFCWRAVSIYRAISLAGTPRCP